jgi:hypothetical protein
LKTEGRQSPSTTLQPQRTAGRPRAVSTYLVKGWLDRSQCGDYNRPSVTIYPALWPELSDLEERFVCTVCGHRGADVRPLFEPGAHGH